MLYYRLSRDRARITMAGNYESIVYEVIRAADAEGWLNQLVVAAQQSRPEHAGLRETAAFNLLATPVAYGLEAVLSREMPEIHPAQWRTRLSVLEGQVGRVEVDGRPRGTGFLVGTDLCLTSRHVIGDTDPARISLRLDYRVDPHGVVVFPGTVVQLAGDWLAGSSPVAELDFALLRLARAAGDEPIGGVGEPGAAARGWIPFVQNDARAGDHVVVLHHPLGDPLQMGFGTIEAVLDRQLRHTADTEAGSSGSPCFTLDWTLIGMHQGSEPVHESWKKPGWNRAVPIAPILSSVPPA